MAMMWPACPHLISSCCCFLRDMPTNFLSPSLVLGAISSLSLFSTADASKPTLRGPLRGLGAGCSNCTQVDNVLGMALLHVAGSGCAGK